MAGGGAQFNLGRSAVSGNPVAAGLKRHFGYTLKLDLGGMLLSIGLALPLAQPAKLIIADELTSRLDISVQAMIIRLIAKLASAHGCAVLLISHDRRLINAVCARPTNWAPKKAAAGPPGLVYNWPAVFRKQPLFVRIHTRN